MNKKFFNMLIIAVLILALTLGLCACGEKTETSSEESGKKGESASNAQEETPEFVYVPEYIEIDGEFTSSFYNSYYTENGIITMTYEKIGEDIPEGATVEYEGQYDVWGTVLYKINFDGTYEKLNYQQPETVDEEGKNTYCNIEGIAPGSDGTLYILEDVSTSWFEAPEGVTAEDDEYWNYYRYENSYYLNSINADGTMGERIDLGKIGEDEEYFYPYGWVIDKEGNLYISCETGVYVLDNTGTVVGKIESDSWVEDILLLSDGRVCANNYGENGYQLSVIDLATMSFGEDIELKGANMYNLIQGGGDYDFYYSNGSNFYGYDLETGESVKILNWINCDVDTGSMGQVSVTDDGRIVFMESEWNSDYTKCTNSLCVVSQKPYDSVPHKENITLATVYLDYTTRAEIIKFNKNNPNYRIEVKDYSEYNTNEDYSAGQTKLQTEIMAGTVPDIIDLSYVSANQLAAQGMLEDLYPYLDSDPELSRDDYFESILTGLEVDGKLYTTASNFYVSTVMGASSVVGDEPGWTVDEFKAALASMPEGCEAFDYYTTKDTILSEMLSLDMDTYVNWTTGECSFNTEGFTDMLEFANTFQSEFNWENYEYSEEDDTPNRVASGRQMLVSTSISDFYDYRMYEAMFGGDVTFIGYPTSVGNGNSLHITDKGYGISASSEHKDVAWQFLRKFFTEEYQSDERYSYGFPINKNAFNKKLEAAMTPVYRTDADGNYILDENGNKIEESQGGWGWGSLMVEMYALTKEQADKIVELINTTTKIRNYDNEIIEIVQEEVKPFFEGQKTAADVAKIIQSKVNIYVNEQR